MVRPSTQSSTDTFSKSTWIIAIAVSIAMLYFGRRIFIPLALALILSFLLTPAVTTLQKLHLARILSVILVMLCSFTLIAAVAWGVSGQLLEITGHIHDYRSNLETKIRSLHSHRNSSIAKASASVQELNKELSEQAAAAAAKENTESARHIRPLPVEITPAPTNFVQSFRSLLGPLTEPIETSGLVIIFIAFMLIHREDLRNRLIRLGGQGQLTVVTHAMEDASQKLSRYLLLQLLVNSSYGLLFGIGLFLIGVPHALLWGALATILRYVPYIGIWIAISFPMAMAAAVFPGWKQCLLTFALFAVLELIVTNFVEPWLYGSHTGISPLAILVAAVFWATLWGPVGLILSTPLTLCLILAGRYVPQMNFLQVLLGDQPVLTPQELYYQRLLAMDEEEARNVAQSYLQDKSLEALYESVLIPALRLAEEDRHSDALGDRSCDFISQSTRELIDDIEVMPRPDEAGETQPDPAFAQASVVCIPARDEADELVGMMLAQLLRRAGNKGARYLSIGTVEDMLQQVGHGGFRIACISALPPFAVGQARALCRQLRSRFPELQVMVGLWGFAGGVPKAQERVGEACTDAVCTNLTEALLQARVLAELTRHDLTEVANESGEEHASRAS